MFEFGILTFDIRVKFALEQMWALKCLQTRRDVCSLPAVDTRRFTSQLPWPPATLLVSDYPAHPAAYLYCCRLSLRPHSLTPLMPAFSLTDQ